MQDQQQQLISRLKETKNILVTVSKDPSVDQLAAAIGLTVALNRMEKHATAVFSGEIPDTLQFLRPEETLEKTTDSLRDFIIALDKSKADKLRYKVEDQVVRIFITPYHTALTEKDLDFSQGDFNVDAVVALGVQNQQDIDAAVQAHGRILHDATVITIALEGESEIGAINWVEPGASSLSEMVLQVVEALDKHVVDAQVATSLLTGIVAMTDRFSNDRTTPQTMSASATLMAAGANQQLITSELEAPAPEPEPESEPADDADSPAPEEQNDAPAEGEDPPAAPPPEPGVLEIDHEQNEASESEEPEAELPPVAPEHEIHVDENGQLIFLGQNLPPEGEAAAPPADAPVEPSEPKVEVKRGRIEKPPVFDEKLSANTEREAYSPPTEQLAQPTQSTPILSHHERVLDTDAAPAGEPETLAAEAPPVPPDVPAAPADEAPKDTGPKTLAELEQEVNSPHLHAQDPGPQFLETPINGARDAVDAALQETASAPEPITALNAQPLGPELHADENPPTPTTEPQSPTPPSAFPGAPAAEKDDGQPAPPPVAPPFYPPTQ